MTTISILFGENTLRLSKIKKSGAFYHVQLVSIEGINNCTLIERLDDLLWISRIGSIVKFRYQALGDVWVVGGCALFVALDMLHRVVCGVDTAPSLHRWHQQLHPYSTPRCGVLLGHAAKPQMVGSLRHSPLLASPLLFPLV